MFLHTPVLHAGKTLKNNLLREESDLHGLKEQFIVHLFLMEDIGTEEHELDVDTPLDCMRGRYCMEVHILYSHIAFSQVI